MEKQKIIILIAIFAAIVLISIILIIKNTRSSELKKKIDELYVAFNAIKTVPIPFKLNKAQIMAKRSEQTLSQVNECFKRYEKTEAHINEIQEILNDLDDDLQARRYENTKAGIENCRKLIESAEKEVSEIDEFLDEFTKKENDQREFASDLKEKYRVVKNTINENANLLSIAYDGICKKLIECEELFSSAEEWMYASDYESAQNDLNSITQLLEDIKLTANAAPKCIKDTKGVIPVMLEEAKRELSLTRQRGVYVEHLDADNKIAEIETNLLEDVRKIVSGNTDGIRDHCHEAKKTLNDLIDKLAAENRSFKEAKENNDKAKLHIQELQKVENYVRVAYDKDSERFGLEDLKEILKNFRDKFESYLNRNNEIYDLLASAGKAASEILLDAENLCEDIDADSKELYSYKTIIDKSSDGESRAVSQLIKLQLVVSETEAKIAEYHLPTIASSYSDDLASARQYIRDLKKFMNEVPIQIDILNELLDEAIDFIYKFYNNVNNIVGMAIMVENAIMFGNKYRSTYPEIDRELSKAEFQYINGEYTKALKTAISCMETLFPDNADEKIMENA